MSALRYDINQIVDFLNSLGSQEVNLKHYDFIDPLFWGGCSKIPHRDVPPTSKGTNLLLTQEGEMPNKGFPKNREEEGGLQNLPSTLMGVGIPSIDGLTGT